MDSIKHPKCRWHQLSLSSHAYVDVKTGEIYAQVYGGLDSVWTWNGRSFLELPDAKTAVQLTSFENIGHYAPTAFPATTR